MHVVIMSPLVLHTDNFTAFLGFQLEKINFLPQERTEINSVIAGSKLSR